MNARDEMVQRIIDLNACRSKLADKLQNAREFAKAHSSEAEFKTRVDHLRRTAKTHSQFARGPIEYSEAATRRNKSHGGEWKTHVDKITHSRHVARANRETEFLLRRRRTDNPLQRIWRPALLITPLSFAFANDAGATLSIGLRFFLH
jgi:hypothetical protein